MADDTHRIQAMVEDVEAREPDTVTFLGQEFRIADRVGLMPLMRFAHVSSRGADTRDMDSLAVMYEMLRDCIDTTRPQRAVVVDGEPQLDEHGQPVMENAGPSEWDRFEQAAVDGKAGAEELFAVVAEVVQALTARPTRRPSDSSAGPPPTSASSRAISSSVERPPAPVPATAPDPGAWADVVSIGDLLQDRQGPVHLTA